ncbi:carotenoid oxygenase family protein [Terricaulis silvestris]|nr:carotenoid oxygenase family protein [Terricaulis silvestris]
MKGEQLTPAEFRGFTRAVVQTQTAVTGNSESYEFGEGRCGGEAPFAPRINAEDEDDGYLVSFVIGENAGKSECVVIDAKRIADGPVARIALPHKICSGTHACWADRAFLVSHADHAGANTEVRTSDRYRPAR